jgi:uncharacterized membrane protein YdjX (TVP38/TMEM64 family)
MPESIETLPQPLHKRYKRGLIIAFVVCVAVTAAFAALFWPQARALILFAKDNLVELIEMIREAGPGWFFAAFAILPAFGVPLSLFTFTVAPTFASQIGLGWVIVFSALSLLFNVALSYWLARYALHPVIEALVKRLGYKLPRVEPDEHVALAIMLRVVPGPPYAVQSYILGLAKVRFFPYMIVSFIGQFGWTLAAIFFGDALMKGGAGKTGFIALSLIVALVIGTRMLRKRYAKKTPVKPRESRESQD